MPLIAQDAGGDFEMVEPGTYAAICTRILDMGLQPLGTYGDKRRILITWELDEMQTDGEPFLISQSYTLSLSKKANLRNDLQSWRGKVFSESELAGFDLENLVGKGCMLNIIHNAVGDKTYANIASISTLPRGMKPPTPKGELLVFSCDAPDMKILEKLSEKMGDKITTGMAKLKVGTTHDRPIPPVDTSSLDDDLVPF